MATHTDIQDLSDDDKALMFQALGVYFNQTLLSAFLQGIYTGIIAFTLWKIFCRGEEVSWLSSFLSFVSWLVSASRSTGHMQYFRSSIMDRISGL
ncbi:hypothetical protein DFS33DRAFT_1378291 [Desarmillaria ectypa]|nr:hypothetical protein DFS33DRAFT_1378291 [Desarmillaria ectypa]